MKESLGFQVQPWAHMQYQLMAWILVSFWFDMKFDIGENIHV